MDMTSVLQIIFLIFELAILAVIFYIPYKILMKTGTKIVRLTINTFQTFVPSKR